jgi:hypothetical protein
MCLSYPLLVVIASTRTWYATRFNFPLRFTHLYLVTTLLVGTTEVIRPLALTTAMVVVVVVGVGAAAAADG